MAVSLAGRLLERPTRASSWIEFLKNEIDFDWRPGEFDPETLDFVPDPDHQDNTLTVCARNGCWIRLDRAPICPACYQEWRDSDSTVAVGEWAASAPVRSRGPAPIEGCRITGCQRTHQASGLCMSHLRGFHIWLRQHPGEGQEVWLALGTQKPLGPKSLCSLGCGRDVHAHGICANHRRGYDYWRTHHAGEQVLTPAEWAATVFEPYYDASTQTKYGELSATPFRLLPEPLRWELLYAVQQRERVGKMLSPTNVRTAYLRTRRAGLSSAVGCESLGLTDVSANRSGLFADIQRWIDAAHREWSGVDTRDPKILYFIDFEMARAARPYGPNSGIDLRAVEHDWIIAGVRAWMHESPRSRDRAVRMGYAWAIASEVVSLRGTPMHLLGPQDMDAIVASIWARWDKREYQQKAINSLDTLLTYTRNRDEFATSWGKIPSRFTIDKSRHRPNAKTDSTGPDDEPFRFVPQPIIEHLMDHLHLLVRGGGPGRPEPDRYLTAEARTMLYVHERCGRRTGETTRLVDDCISYDDEGSPYLEWKRIKPPYSQGKRLPIHQETHDAIRQWQAIKREHGVQSKWLFPNLKKNSTIDDHWGNEYLNRRLKSLIDVVQKRAPFVGPVEGAEGNLINFDLATIDAYSFRHAFAQRYADATDENGRSTTPPDVLQDLMGHATFNTTMAYYEVSTRRRKRVLASVPPRRLNIHGDVVAVDRERDSFTKVAVTLGHCTEPQNVAAHGHGCMLDHACESCPFFLVDPLERDGMDAKRHTLMVHLERARAINAQQHVLDHYEARIKDCTTIIDGIDAYLDQLPSDEREGIQAALETMANVRRLATAPRRIDLRNLFKDAE